MKHVLLSSCRSRLSTVVALGMMAGAVFAAPPTLAKPWRVVFVIDRSGSMQEVERMRYTIEAAKIGIEILGGGELQIIKFADRAETGPVFNLATDSDKAHEYLKHTRPEGGTSYLAALEKISGDPLAVIFLSDGMPTDPPERILDYLRDNVHAPVYTIAMETTPEAEELLAKMAAATEAGSYRARSAPEVVEAFLKILGQMRRFWRYDLKDESVTLDARGPVLVIGYGVAPRLVTTEAIRRHEARLPEHTIYLARTVLAKADRIAVAASGGATSDSVIATVIRFDLPKATMEVARLPSKRNPNAVRVRASFTDAEGKPIDPRGSASLRSTFQVVDPDGHVLSSAVGKPSAHGPSLEATVTLPSGPNAPRCELVRQTAIETAGIAFTSREQRALDVDALPSAPAPRATTTVSAACGAPEDPMRCVVVVDVADSADADAAASLLEGLRDHPPVVEVETPDGERYDSASDPDHFTATSRVVGNKLIEEVVFRPVQQPGLYRIIAREGAAAGYDYPEANTTAQCFGPDQLQLLIVAHRNSSGRQVLFDTAQENARPALVGDRISVELVRGTMDPRVFIALGQGLYARFIGEDGAVTNVDLDLQDGRYVTAPVPMTRPGILGVEVDISIPGLQLQFKACLKVQRLRLELAFADGSFESFFGRFAHLPQLAEIPFEIEVHGTIDAAPAAREELLEIFARDGIRLRRTLRDSTGRTLDTDVCPAGTQPWRGTIWFQHRGQQTLLFELVDKADNVLHALAWQLRVVDSPVRFTLGTENAEGELADLPESSVLASWLPSWCVGTPDCRVVARPVRSPLFGTYYLAAVTVDGAEVPFDERRGQYAAALDRDGEYACVGRLQQLNAGLSPHFPEIQVRTNPVVERPQVVRPIRTGLTALSGMVLLCAAVGSSVWGAGRWRLGRLVKIGRRISVFGDSYVSVPIVPPRQTGCWPRAELFICGSQNGSDEVVAKYPQEVNGQHRVLARIRQNLNGPPVLTAEEDLPELRKGEFQRLEPGNETVRISSNTTVSLEPDDVDLTE